jgi:DNA repair exonuclease SbcCD ATPase subunit
MKIKSIRLHPFAGIPERTIGFHDGLNLVLGENEFGKSTIFNALSAVLFIPERPRKGSEDHKAIERCYPRAGGTEIRVTLRFDAEGTGYVLLKTWSTQPRLSGIRLQSGGTELTGEQAEAEMARLLLLNRASWENMLFIEQSSIHETIGRLKPRIGSLDTVQSFLKDADPFDREGFVKAVRERLKRLESRWDSVMQMPEGGRGIQHPWARDVGSILEAWYEKEGFRERQQEILKSEMRVEELNRQIHDLTTQKLELEGIILRGEPLLKDANRSLAIQSEKKELERKGNELKEVHRQWMAAETALPMKRQDLEQLLKEKMDLDTELQHANRRANGSEMIRRDKEVRKLEDRITEQKDKLVQMPDIPEAVVKEVDASEQAVRDARLRLEAQQLRTTFESDVEVQIHATVSGQQPSIVTVRPGMPETLSSPGSIAISHGPLSIRVVSGNEDIDKLEATLLHHQQRIRERCAAQGAEDSEGLRNMRVRLLEARSELQKHERDLKAQLGGKSLLEWRQELEELAGIPATRDLQIIREQLDVRTQRTARLGLEISGMSDKAVRWKHEHGNPEDLLEKVTELRSEWKRLDKEASTLLSLPEGSGSAADFIESIQQSQQRLNGLQGALNGYMAERGHLQGQLSKQEYSAEELLEKQQSAEARYAHLLREVRSLHRILDMHGSIASERAADPFASVGTRITALLQRLSGGRYALAEFDENLPVVIGNEDIRLEADLLSKGMKGSLALAVRLAYAEVYLSDMDGFLMLDDPFTELDPNRRRQAAELLQEIGIGKQVILFTCHPEHAGLFPPASAVVAIDAASPS